MCEAFSRPRQAPNIQISSSSPFSVNEEAPPPWSYEVSSCCDTNRKQTNSASPFFTHTSSSQSFFSRLSKSLDRSLMLKFRSSLARWWLKSVPHCARRRSPGLALRSRSLSVPTGGPLSFHRGRCLFPLVDLCTSLAFASCSPWRTFGLPSRSLPVLTAGPLHFPRHRCLLFPLADLWSLFLVPTGGPVLG
jgi:hypothetical protein